jgi:hypothetical protein
MAHGAEELRVVYGVDFADSGLNFLLTWNKVQRDDGGDNRGDDDQENKHFFGS